MTAAILVITAACAIFWLVFFKLKLLKLTPGWGFVFGFFVLHLLLVFMIGLRFVTPNSANATVVQHTIQLIPRLPEPTLVTAVLVEENVPVKKDQPLFQFDRRPYEYKVEQIKAQLAEAMQNVLILKADVEVATQKATKAKVNLSYMQHQKQMFDKLAKEQAVREQDVVQWATRQQPPPNVAQGQYAVKIVLDDADLLKFPIGAQGTAAIYTSGEHGAWAVLRKISIRAHSWFNWLYPINF
jgi:multidrug resistance efflux pump